MTTTRNCALRVCLAVARENTASVLAVLREAGELPGGLVALVLALATAANANAQALAPDDWIEQLEFMAVAEEALHDDS